MRLILVLCALALVSPAYAADLYVNNSGSPACSDATTKAANSASSPWCSITRATHGSSSRSTPNSGEAAAAGDTVYVTAGTYQTTGTGDRFLAAYGPINTGSSEAPIIMEALGPVYCTYSSGAGPCYGHDNSYIEWRGPTGENAGWIVDGANATSTSDTGPVVISGNSEGGVIDGMTIIGVGRAPWCPDNCDNYPGIRLEYVLSATIRNVWISAFGGSGSSDPNAGLNEVAIQAYRSGDIVLEHIHIEDSTSGVFLKGIAEEEQTGRWDIRYNRFESVQFPLVTHRVGNSINPLILWYQNVIDVSSGDGAMLFNFGDSTNVRNTHIVNNTFYDMDGQCFMTLGAFQSGIDASNSFQNNICHTMGAFAVGNIGGGNALFQDHADMDFDRNVYYNTPANFAGLGQQDTNTFLSFASWQGSPNNQDPNSITSNPLLADPAGGDFRLCTASGVPHASCSGASPALTLGRVVHNIGGTNGATIPAGAYITGSETIGVQAAGEAGAGSPIRLRFRGGQE